MENDLIVLEDGIPIFNPAARTVPEFNAIIVRARKKGKYHYKQADIATTELAYVWFMESYLSPYQARYPDNEMDRDRAVRMRLKVPEWEALNDDEIIAAREAYRGDMSYRVEERLLKNARIVANKLAEQFEALAMVSDPNSKDVTKRPGSILSELREVGKVIDDLKEIETRARASEKKSNIYGGKSKNVFEDPPRKR